MATSAERVEIITEDVQEKVTSLFNDLQKIAYDAINRAYADISAEVGSSNTIALDADIVPIDIDSILAEIERLKNELLDIPDYPEIDYTLPDFPTLDETPPDIDTVVFPTAPDYNIPAFSETAPDETVVNPDIAFDYADIEYVSELKDALYDILLEDVQNGDYGLDATDEERLFNRARDREVRTMQGNIDNSIRLFSAGGFTIPTGAAQRAVLAANRDAEEKISSMNRELLIKKADLYANFKQFTITSGINFEKILMDYHSNWMERLLKVALQRVTSTIEIASFQLARLKWFMERFKTLADVYKIQVEAEGVKADVYKAQVEASKAMVEANTSIIEQWSALNKAITDLYAAKVDAYTAKIDAQVKQLTALSTDFQSRVSAFAAIVGALAKSYELQSSDNSALAQVEVALLSAKVQNEKNRMDAIINSAQIELEGKKAEANVAMTIGSSALNALNVQASLGASGTASQSAETSYNHQYQE